MSPSIRQRNVAAGSSLGEFYIRTRAHPTAANDYGEVFVFPRASRIQLMELGVSVGAVTTSGNGAAANVAYLPAGLVGSEVLIQDPETASYTLLHSHVGTVYELGVVGFRAERAADNQPYLAQLLNRATFGQGSNSFDDETNMHIRLGLLMDSVTVFTGFAYAHIKVWYPEDE